MMEIDPKKLLYFASIIEHGSLSRAAQVLGVSQPALTTSMDRLEAEVGMQLLKRSTNGIVATHSGDIMYCHARLIRKEIQLAERNLLTADDRQSESIRIGSLPSLSSKIVPMALSKWREIHTNGHLEAGENAQIDLLTGLLHRDFDFVFGLTEVFDVLDGLRQRVLFRDTLCVIAGPNHPLQYCTPLNWEDLVKYPWITPTSQRSHTLLDHIAQKMGAPLRQKTVCGSVSLLKSMVAETEHLALLPAHAVQEEVFAQRLIALPFHHPILCRGIAVFFREGYIMDQPRLDLVACMTEVGLNLCRDKNN
jgi:DNA-binding transcriptional LysR family regulator